ncbi:hypothetical protein [Pendulispora albinea]|uniref:Uncharacterized protein n=1 Tax=Pendulispora albinea TaxID=2741071 RepID=A0ABZ2M6Y8_9BACT
MSTPSIPFAIRTPIVLAPAMAAMACSGSPAAEPKRDLSEVVIADPSTCVDPRDHGAVPNDGLDDRAALQAAIDLAKVSGRPVCLAPGRFDIQMNPGAGNQNIESLRIWNTDGFTMVGAGSRSVLAFKGSGISPGTTVPRDWWLLGLRGARNTHLGHFEIDGAARFDTDEQTHAIQLTHLPAGFDGNPSPISTRGTTLEHVDFFDPHLPRPAGSVPCGEAPAGQMCQRPNHGGTPILCAQIPGYSRCSVTNGPAASTWTLLGFFGGGDCVRLAAEETLGVRVADTTVEGSRATCDRSFVALQRGVDGYRVVNNTVDAVDDTAVDEEPTGEGTARRAYIVGNTFHRGGGRKAGILLTMSGNTEDSTENVISGNLLDGSISAYNTSNTIFAFNTITIAEDNTTNIQLIKRGSGNRIFGNTLVREATAAAGNAILVRLHNSGFPSDVIISDNVIRMRSDGNAIQAEPAVGLVVDGNIIEGSGPTADTFSAFVTRGSESVGTGSQRITFTGNQVRGRFRRMFIEGQFMTQVNHATVITGNIFEPATTGSTISGVVFESGCPTPAPIVDGNVFRGLPAARHVEGACGAGWIGQNSGP